MLILDILFPRTCVGCGRRGMYFCPECVASFPLASPICPLCGRGSIGGLTHEPCARPLGLDGLVALFAYRDGVKAAVKRLKYRFVHEMALGFVETALVRADPAMIAFFQRQRMVVVPVPLFPSRERWRGFNQAAMIGELMAQRLRLSFVLPLERVKDTQALAELKVSLTDEEEEALAARYPSTTQRALVQWRILSEKKSRARAEEMQGAFKPVSHFEFRNSNFLLVDDVWTSGATMAECAKTLKRNGAAKVWGFTFARGGR